MGYTSDMQYNRVTLMGYLTRDPELTRVGSKNTSLVKFGMAVNEKYTSRDGVKKERVVFVDIVVWARAGEVIHEYLSKGDPIFIDGRLEFSTWIDKGTGKNRSKLEVVAEKFQFVGGKRDDTAAAPSDLGPGASAAPTDDVPF